MKIQKKKYLKLRHRFFFAFARILLPIIGGLYHFSFEKYPVKRGEHYLILSNHQTLLDPALVCFSFPTPLYIMANDTLFNRSLASRALTFCFGPIKKKKASSEIASIKECVKIAKEGGSILVFPEGNRAWADFPMYIDPAICKLVRLINSPLILYNLKGGYGVDPRWGRKLRKGSMRGEIREVISVEELKEMDDNTLYQRIVDGLRVIDSESGEAFESEVRAEYLERELFICPNCQSIATLHSHGDKVSCNNCDMEATYTKDLRIEMKNGPDDWNHLVDWYRYQQHFLREMEICSDEKIYVDEAVTLIDKTTERRIKLLEGTLILTDTTLTISDATQSVVVALSDIVGATVVGANKLVINTKEQSFQFRGDERFNALKYVLTFNRLETGIGKEKYYGLGV